MAGDIYVEALSHDDVANIERCGGILEKSVFHSDKADNAHILEERLSAVSQNRRELPPHCYITFNKNSTDKIQALGLSSILQKTSRPAGIVKIKQGLATWAQSSDVQKAMLLYAEIQNGPIKLEFYKIGLWGVVSHYKDFQMVKE